ncbi:MAG: hypothetical protein A2X40_02375 [Elusimicrobia bacterium GWC2_65_9]|nr:MAG: hypothetical protein A2X37_08930 [Elusimicrobia bacterium GWA2_66_18]OGR71444.1 MAG: hypothetical protein A2X40_02375 [Elusimicrobia bacterium GWC2_65_9]
MNLREIVGKLAGCPASDVGPDFRLDGPGLSGSMKKSILIASVRRQLGVECMRAAQAKTFAELESVVRAAASAGAKEPSESARVLAGDLERGELPAGLRCGIDVEAADALPLAQDYANHEFYRDAFTLDEIAYCAGQANPRIHFAARWCAKESLKKCDPVFLTERMGSIEVVRRETGGLRLVHHGSSGRRDLEHAVSIAHTDSIAAAVVVAPVR